MITQEKKKNAKVSKESSFLIIKKNKNDINQQKKKELLESIEDAKKSSMTFDDVPALFSYLKS